MDPVILASSLDDDKLRTEENISVLVVSQDNKTFAINMVGSHSGEVNEDHARHLPGCVSLTEKPLENFRVISRIISKNKMNRNVFKDNCRVVANSLEDKLKSYVVLKRLKDLL